METILQTGLDIVLLLAFVGCVALILHPESTIRVIGGVGAVIALVALVAALGAIVVPAGNVGVITAFGQVQNDTLPPGLHFRLPFVNQAHMIDTRVQPHGFQEIDAASSEYQSVKLTGIMNYHIDGSAAADLYQRVGDDFAAKILDPAFNDYIKSVVPEYSISQILGKRDEIRQRAKQDLQANVAQYHIVVDDIYIQNISFSDEYEKAIEEKQVAQQQVQTQIQITQQKTEQKKQAQIDAEGQAAARVAQAEGEATATKTLAAAQAEANRLLSQSLTPELIQYTMIQKLAPSVQTIILPSGQNFILDPKSLAGAKQ